MKQRKVSGIGTILLLTWLFCLLLTNHSWGSNQQTSSAEEGTDVTITGELTVLSIDDFDRRSAKVLYHLKDPGSGRVFNLHFPGEPSGKLRTGSIVTVRGKAKDQDIYLFADSSAGQLQQVVTTAAAVTGEQKTIVIVADFRDATVACSVPDIDYRVFTDPLNKSVDDLYHEMSFGQLWLTGDVVGPFIIKYTTTSACDVGAWASAADAAASASGVKLGDYNRKIYVLPKTNPCGYIGVGTVGGSPSMSWIFRCDVSEVFAHEFGHNLGMNHASTPANEYGDTSDIMGYGGFGLRQVNAPHQDQTGWLNPTQMKGVMESGTYMIAPIELSPDEALAPQILIVPKPDTAESYYLSYRQALGFDAGLSPIYLKGVNIQRYKTDTADRTYLLAVLDDGQAFTDDVNGVTVTQVAHSSGYVTVQIQMNTAPVCFTNAPAVSVLPSGQGACAGWSLPYTVNVTNMDSTDCQAATFSVSASVPEGWSGSVSPSTLTLTPGATARTTLTVTSSATAAAGDYEVTVNVSDAATAAHAASGTATYTVSVAADTTPPSAPAGLTAKVLRGKVSLSWTASTDNVKVAGYKVWRNNAVVVQTTGTTYTDTAVTSGQTYTYVVTAFDAVGNASAASNPATVTVSNSGGGKKK